MLAVYAKAVAGGLIAFGSSLVIALGDNTISLQEWVTAAIAGLIATGIVSQVPNKKAP